MRQKMKYLRIKVAFAETRGFEPPRPFNGPTSLAVRRTRPGYATSPSGGRSLQVSKSDYPHRYSDLYGRDLATLITS